MKALRAKRIFSAASKERMVTFRCACMDWRLEQTLDIIALVLQLDDELICLNERWAMRVQGSGRLNYLGLMAIRALIHPNQLIAPDHAVASRLREGKGNHAANVNLRRRTIRLVTG